MQNELGLNYACSTKVIGLFEESIETVQEYDNICAFEHVYMERVQYQMTILLILL